MSRHRDARQLTQSAQEELRRRAVAMVRSGLTQLMVAELLDVSRGAVGMWFRRAELEGDESLQKRTRGQPEGQRQRLSGTQAATICGIIRDRCPDHVKLPFALWTREAVQRLIYEQFGVDLAIRTVGDYLARWGFTVQKPAVRVYECNSEAVRRWVEAEYPRIAARAKAERAQGMTSLLLLLACSGGKSPDYPPPPCSYDWTDAPCSEQYLDRVRCDPCGKAWKCGPVDWEERYPIWVRQDHDCTCESEDGLWYEEPGCGGGVE